MNSLVNSLDSGNEFGSSPIDSVIVTSSESMIVSVGSNTANNISTKNIDLTKGQTDSRYLGVKLEPSKRLELTNEADRNPWSDPQFSLNTLVSNSSILLLGVNDGVDTIEESQDILNQPFGLCNPFVDFNFVNFRGYLEMNYPDRSPISVFPEPEFTDRAEPPAERLSFERLPIPLGPIPWGPAHGTILGDDIIPNGITLINPHPERLIRSALPKPELTDAAEGVSDEPLPIQSGPADDTFLGDGSDYPDREVCVTYYEHPPCYGYLGPDVIQIVERPAQDEPEKPVTLRWWPADDTFLGDISDYPDGGVVVTYYKHPPCYGYLGPDVIRIFERPSEDEPEKPVTLPPGPADDTFLGDGSDYPDREVFVIKDVRYPDPPCYGPLEPGIIHFTITAERPPEDVPVKPVTIPPGPADDTFLGDGSDYPDREVFVMHRYPGPPCYGPLEPEIIHSTITAVMPPEDGPGKPVTIPSGPADDTFLGDGSDYPDRVVRVYFRDPPCSYGPLEPGFIRIFERPAQDEPEKPGTIPFCPVDDTFLGDGSDYWDGGVLVEYDPGPCYGYLGPDVIRIFERPAQDEPDKLRCTVEGGATYNTDIEKLVQAMASFAPPAAMQTSWTSGQTITGNILLAVSH